MTNKHLINLKKRYIKEGYKLAKKKLLKEYKMDKYGNAVTFYWDDKTAKELGIPNQRVIMDLEHIVRYGLSPKIRGFLEGLKELDDIDQDSIDRNTLNRARIRVIERYNKVKEALEDALSSIDEVEKGWSL